MKDCVKKNHCPYGRDYCCDYCSIYELCSYVCRDSNCEVRCALIADSAYITGIITQPK